MTTKVRNCDMDTNRALLAGVSLEEQELLEAKKLLEYERQLAAEIKAIDDRLDELNGIHHSNISSRASSPRVQSPRVQSPRDGQSPRLLSPRVQSPRIQTPRSPRVGSPRTIPFSPIATTLPPLNISNKPTEKEIPINQLGNSNNNDNTVVYTPQAPRPPLSSRQVRKNNLRKFFGTDVKESPRVRIVSGRLVTESHKPIVSTSPRVTECAINMECGKIADTNNIF